jgi:pyrophosphatase PpaX
MPRLRTVLFDLDGTLIDSIRLILDSFHHTLAAFGLSAQEDAVWMSGIGVPLTVHLRRFAADDATLAAMIAAYRAYNLEHHDARVKAYPGVVEAVRALRAEGIRIGVVTSKALIGTRRGLAAAGIADAVEAIVSADDVVNPKPHREPVDRAVALLSADPRTTLFVGDSVHDMRSGRAAAVRTGAALWGPFRREDLAETEPDHWLESPMDVVRAALR